jgi:hypothetical protein
MLIAHAQQVLHKKVKCGLVEPKLAVIVQDRLNELRLSSKPQSTSFVFIRAFLGLQVTAPRCPVTG